MTYGLEIGSYVLKLHQSNVLYTQLATLSQEAEQSVRCIPYNSLLDQQV